MRHIPVFYALLQCVFVQTTRLLGLQHLHELDQGGVLLQTDQQITGIRVHLNCLRVQLSDQPHDLFCLSVKNIQGYTIARTIAILEVD